MSWAGAAPEPLPSALLAAGDRISGAACVNVPLEARVVEVGVCLLCRLTTGCPAINSAVRLHAGETIAPASFSGCSDRPEVSADEGQCDRYARRSPNDHQRRLAAPGRSLQVRRNMFDVRQPAPERRPGPPPRFARGTLFRATQPVARPSPLGREPRVSSLRVAIVAAGDRGAWHRITEAVAKLPARERTASLKGTASGLSVPVTPTCEPLGAPEVIHPGYHRASHEVRPKVAARIEHRRGSNWLSQLPAHQRVRAHEDCAASPIRDLVHATCTCC